MKEINGIDVIESVLTATNNDVYYSQKVVDELQNEIKRLQKENEELKEENEQLKTPCLVMPKVNQLAVPIDKYVKLYKALEEIRGIVSDEIDKTDADDELMQIYGTIYNRCNEALNEQK